MFYQDSLAMHGTKLIYWKIEPARRLSESSGVVYQSLHQVITTESGEMWWDFRVFRGNEARLDGQLQLVREGKESQFTPGFVGGASGRWQLPLSSVGN